VAHADGGATSAPTVAGHSAPVATPTKEIEGFSHMVLEVKDLGRSERFYQQVIGLEPMGRGLLAEPREHSLLRMATGQMIVLLQDDNPIPIRDNTSSIHHAFLMTMDQYKAAEDRFKAAGFDISDTREAFRAKGEHSMDVYDPDGHRWQVQAFDEAQHEIIKSGLGVVDCGPAGTFRIGSVVTNGKGNFFLYRSRKGFLAINRWCRHANGLLTHQPEHWRFYCAFHGATYNMEGDHIGHLPNIPALRLHPVTFSANGNVLVDTDVFIERDPDTEPEYVAAPEAALAAR
jgi:catechol 2,3-dioxygenase-like lactoylglutathione lyase family enzyme